jgi:predicted permease
MLARLRSLVRSVFGRGRMEQDMAEEFGFHFERRIEDLTRAGVSPTEAARQARLEFGAREAYKDECREARGLRFFDECGQDLRYAFRTLRSNPGFAAVAILSLALGIGANTAIFSLLDAVMLKSLPVARPGELDSITSDGATVHSSSFSYPLFQRFRDTAPTNSLLAMARVSSLNALAPGERESAPAMGQLVSGEYFATLGVYPELGRLLTSEDNRIVDGHPVTVISYGFWQRRFGSSPGVLGQQIQLNGTYFTIVGVASRSFSGVWTDSPVDLWLPLVMQHTIRYAQHYSANAADPSRPWAPQDGMTWLDVILRANPEQRSRLRTVLNSTFQQLVAERAQRVASQEERRLFLDQHLTFQPFGRGFSRLRRQFAAPLWALMAMVALVLLIACANVANLLLARSSARQREIAVRLSIGASRGRLIRQLLTESTLVAVLGGAAGVATAHWASAFLVRMALDRRSGAVPPAFELDLGVLAFAAALSLATGIVFGLAPAFRTTRVQLSDALKAGSRTVFSGSRVGGMRPLVSLQVALSLAMLVGAGLFGRSLRNLMRVDPGFDREHLLSVWIDPQVVGLPVDRLPGLHQRLIERIEAVPGVRSASISSCGLANGCVSFMDGINISGYQRRPGEQVLIQSNWVGPRYFTTVGMRIVAGRELDTRDTGHAPKVAVINEAMARRYFANRNPLGERFGYVNANTEIVGVVRDARVTYVRDAAVPMAYYAMEQSKNYSHNIDVRSAGDPAWIATQVRGAVAEVAPSLPIIKVATLSDQISSSVNLERLVVYLTSAFGVLALALACVGLYGVMSYAVSRRTAELGIRMALGAPRRQVLWMVMRESLMLVGLGVAVGLPLVLMASRFLKGMLFGLAPNDSATVLSAILVLVTVAAIAGYLPALRASRIEPLVALRYE